MSGLIPKGFIDDLLRRTSITDLVRDHVPDLKTSGNNSMACCPFHDEKTPSFSVNEDKQFFNCFGCGEHGNALTFLMKIDGLNFPQAVENLAGRAGVEVPREGGDKQSNRPSVTPLYDAMTSASNTYQKALDGKGESSKAAKYLQDKGITRSVALEYMLGYAMTSGNNFSEALSKNKNMGRPLMETGLLVKDADNGRVQDLFQGHITFPVLDNSGRPIGFGGQDPDEKQATHLYTEKSPVFDVDRELFGLYQARRSASRTGSLIIADNCLEVVALAQHGIPNAVATMGVAPSANHVVSALRVSKDVTFVFENSPEGQKDAMRALESVLPHMTGGTSIRFLFPPEGQSLADIARTQGAEAAHEFSQSNGVSAVQLLFHTLANERNANNQEGIISSGLRIQRLIDSMADSNLKKLAGKRLDSMMGGLGQKAAPEVAQVIQSREDLFAAMPDSDLKSRLIQEMAARASEPQQSAVAPAEPAIEAQAVSGETAEPPKAVRQSYAPSMG